MLWPKEDQEHINEFIEKGEQVDWKPLQITMPLLGYHQVQNAATAFSTIREARKQGIKFSDKAIEDGFTNVQWPGRFELISKDPIVILDSAHNQDSALKLRVAIDDYLSEKPVILIFGVSED